MKNKYLKVAKIFEVKLRYLIDCYSEDISASQSSLI